MDARATALMLLVVLLATSARLPAAEAVFPGATWATKTPAEVGLDVAKLKAFSDKVGGHGCVTRHGYMVYAWGDATKPGDVASAAKPVYSHFLIQALEQGRIPDFTQRVSRLEPRLDFLNRDLGRKDGLITWWHLAYQTACYGVTEAPGTAFCYNDWQMALFWDLLFLKVYGATYETVDEKVLHPLLTAPLQCEDKPTLMAFGPKDRPGRLAISPRDFCRFGLLYLRKGAWNGKQILRAVRTELAVTRPLANSVPQSAGKLARMLDGQRTIGSDRVPDNQCDHLGSYSWLWWTNGVDRQGKRHWPDAPTDTYGALGHGGQRAMAVIPSLDVVLSWNDANVRSREAENEALGLLVRSTQE